MMNDWHGSGGGVGWIGFGVMMFVFWSLIVAVVIAALRWPALRHDGASSSAPPQDHALLILQERFARGEIDAEEFTRRRDLLRSS